MVIEESHIERTVIQSRNKLEIAEEANTRFRWIILVGLILAAAMEVLDTTIVSVAQAQMAGNLGATTQDIAWVSTAYILANVVVLPMTAFLTARFGRRSYMTASILLFTLASFLCTTSHGLGEMILWRILQGAGGAALISTAQATLVQVFPQKEQAVVQPIFLMGLVVAPTLGPTLGGWLTEIASWQWCFLINVPIGIISTIIIYLCLHDTEVKRIDEPVDWPGLALLTLGLGSLQYVLEEGERNNWFEDLTITRLSFTAVVSLILLVIWQLSPRNKYPVLNLRVLKNRSLTAGIILFIIVGIGMYGVSYLYPLLAQSLQGMSALQTGLAMLPGGIATAVSISLCGVIVNNPKSIVDPRGLTFIGIIMTAYAMWLFSYLNSQSGVSDTFLPLLLRGFALGFFVVPVNFIAIGDLKPDEITQGVGLTGLARQLGGSIGIALLATQISVHSHISQMHLINSSSSANMLFQQRVANTTGLLTLHGYNQAQAQAGAYHLVNQLFLKEAMMLAYNHTFMLLMLITIATAPVLFLMRKPKAGSSQMQMH